VVDRGNKVVVTTLEGENRPKTGILFRYVRETPEGLVYAAVLKLGPTNSKIV